mmetsp:Transcript_11720/g.27136  ORF Transcript_11720/g.27136 Transcript_11720/m.27136 type:complete len:88 (-) Transcript_11720:1318-1581(-)
MEHSRRSKQQLQVGSGEEMRIDVILTTFIVMNNCYNLVIHPFVPLVPQVSPKIQVPLSQTVPLSAVMQSLAEQHSVSGKEISHALHS